jgi:hypothetical protein
MNLLVATVFNKPFILVFNLRVSIPAKSLTLIAAVSKYSEATKIPVMLGCCVSTATHVVDVPHSQYFNIYIYDNSHVVNS